MDVNAAVLGAALATRTQAPLKPGAVVPQDQIEQAAADFEAFYLAQMLGHMFAGLRPDSLFGGGHGETIFRSMMVDEYGKAIARGGGIGIADAVAREMIKLQEGKQP